MKNLFESLEDLLAENCKIMKEEDKNFETITYRDNNYLQTFNGKDNYSPERNVKLYNF
jgi:hypothetical protein